MAVPGISDGSQDRDHRRPSVDAGRYVVRVKVRNGVRLMPQRHLENRIYTVRSGVFYIGVGMQFAPAALVAYAPGSVVLPGDTPHFHRAKSGEYIMRVMGRARSGWSVSTEWTMPEAADERSAASARRTHPCDRVTPNPLGSASTETWPAAGGGLLVGIAAPELAGPVPLRMPLKTVLLRVAATAATG